MQDVAGPRYWTYRGPGTAPQIVCLGGPRRYRLKPVPAGMSFPMITFSFRPRSESLLAWIAASVRTRVVSWKEAADSHDSVASDAFVMPMRTGRPEAGSPPSATTRRFSASKDGRSTSEFGRNSVDP